MKKLLLLLSVLFVVSCSPEPILYMLTTSVSPVDTGVVIPSARQYNEGDTATLIATPAAGTYYYICSLHSGMVGTITIQN